MSKGVGGWYSLPASYRGLVFSTGFPDGKPIAIVTDSIGKALPTHKDWIVHTLSGKTFKDATQKIVSGEIRIGGIKVVVFHLGTNSLDYRGWKHKGSWQEHLPVVQEEVKAIYRAVRRFNATCFIMFSSVLPSGCDWEQTRDLYIALNRFLRSFAREKHCCFMPTYSSFIHKGGVRKGRPLAGLFAVRDGGLHLNLIGRQVFTDPFKMALSTRQLYQTAVAAGFKHWGGSGWVVRMEPGSSRPLGGKEWYKSSGALLLSLGSLVRGVRVPLFPGFLGVGPPAGNSLISSWEDLRTGGGIGRCHLICIWIRITLDLVCLQAYINSRSAKEEVESMPLVKLR